jgi:hypothetical protein
MIKIERYSPEGFLLPAPECIGEFTGAVCKHNGNICNCNVYSGNPTFPNLFEVR